MRVLAALLVMAIFAGYTAISAPHLLTFTIHGDRWTVLQLQALSDSSDDGETNCPAKIITVRKDVAGKSLAETLMHEVMHALACDHGVGHDERWNNSNDPTDGMEGHAGIYWGGKELAEFIGENPQFTAFIQQAYICQQPTMSGGCIMSVPATSH